MKYKILQTFRELFNEEPLLFNAPGRINLIGEHTDYNEGFVFPAAIDKSIVLAIKPNNSKNVRLHAYNLNETYEFYISDFQKSEKAWANYILGVLNEFEKEAYLIEGFDCVFGGNIPYGAGLSSSAAIETVFTYALNHLHQFQIPSSKLIKMAQMAEVKFVGVNCGIMDQFISFNGKKDKALKLDCRTLEYEYFDIDLGDYSIILADTLVKHALASGEYNLRRQECEKGVETVQKIYPNVKNLRDVNIQQLHELQKHFHETIYKRCKFVVEENQRVQNAAAFLQNNMLESFGQELFKSHIGLSQLYEVSCPGLDLLSEEAKKMNGVIGSRMMGGGFGGCTINIVKSDIIEKFEQKLNNSFFKMFNHKPEFHKVRIVDGAGTLVVN
ncbi:MAG: galactokinase [Bacteroidetes bacterium]|jgi:galactokinase|nr:galactokinase [Bacteroidota bacterium]MBT6686640.1 galactokinase [Bacteroidota bacterium]MBT7144850.1 galactokinase [Bacteroidota bacterium]MBT7490238.1 galactokinase [Bacteroidota bacterium]